MHCTHDRKVVGTYANGRCRACQWERNHQRYLAVHLDAGPLRAAMPQQDKAITAFANRWGLTYSGALQAYQRVQRARTVNLSTADRWCVALGLHLAIIYPEFYRMPPARSRQSA